MAHLKMVLVGDDNVGKTCLINTYTKGEFPQGNPPTIFDGTHSVDTNDGIVQLTLCDTGAAEDYDRLRPLSYPQTDIFIICYSIASVQSFNNIGTKWVPEIRKHVAHSPFIIVGNKTDLMQNICEISFLSTNKN
eukprot:458908_1